MTDNRRSMTTEYLEEKRAAVVLELNSDEHYARTPTVAYGVHDPFAVELADCESCGCPAQFILISGSRWYCGCTACCRAGDPPQRRLWQSALTWNGINLGTQDYRDLPLFGLSQLSPEDARERMKGIRRHIELRQQLAGLDRQLAQRNGSRPPGKRYQERLEAYLHWSMLALRLIKNERKTGAPVQEAASE